MSKKKKLILVSLFLFLILGIILFKIPIVGADSGYDSSFSSSSSDSGGSFDISFLIYLAFEHPLLAVIIVICIICYIAYQNKQTQKLIKENIEKGLSSTLELLDPKNYDEAKKIEIEAYNLYKQIQFAWMNFDEDLLRKCTTDEMFNMYLIQMDTLKVKNEKNIMYDIKYLNSNIISEEEVNGQKTIKIIMDISCYDFVVNTNTKQVTRGNGAKVNYYTYELTFVKTSESNELIQCPSCGAPVKGNNSGKCEYCKSTLISNNYTLVLSKKKMLSQR